VDTIKHLIDEFQQLRGERAALNELWQEIAEVLSPERVGFTDAGRGTNRRTDKIFDTTPIVAKRGLVNALGSMLRPKSAAPGKWFDLVPEDEDLLGNKDVKAWVEMAEERLWRALYNPKAKFIESTGEVDDDLVTFGTGMGFTGVRKDQSGLLFRSFHMSKVYVRTDSSNDIETVYVHETLTPTQAAGRWGEENLGEKTKEMLRSTSSADIIKKQMFIWCVGPRHDRDPRKKRSNQHMPIYSRVVDVDSEHLVMEEGYEEMPFYMPRWDTRSGEVYGRGPGVLALPDVLTLNQMGKTMLRGLHRAVDPPWLLPSDSMVNAPQMRPGGVSYYDAKAIRNLGLANPFQQMNSDARIPWGLDAQAASREQLMALFYRNVLNLPVSAPQMTATEVIQRREEFVREIGAVFGRLESDYTGPLVERSFYLMMRNGGFGPVDANGMPANLPEELQGSNISFRFASPVEKAKRQIEEASVSQGIEKVLQIGQIKPEIMDRFNWDELGKFIAEAGDFPADLTLDDKAVQELLAQRQQAAEAEQQMQQLERGVGMVNGLPPAMAEKLVESE
jgi:hypothetical protein